MATRAIVACVLMVMAGCPAVVPLPISDGGTSCAPAAPPDLAGYNPPCGASAPAPSACTWSCFYSAARGYEWSAGECCSDCGALGAVAEPCAWRCTFDPRAGGSFHWEELYQGCSKLDGGTH